MDGFRPDTYGEAFADVYSQWYGTITDAEATADFVHQRCREGVVLELGVGDGRLAIPLAVRGRTVIGIDASASMLKRLTDETSGQPTTSSVLPLLADFGALPIAGPVGGALCAFNTLFNLPTVEQQQALFDGVARALAPGAPFVIEAITGQGLAESADQSVGISRMSVDRLVLSATVVDSEAQTITGQHVDITEAGIRLRPWHLRWTTPTQLDAMASAAGLTLDERVAGWNGAEFGDNSDRHISVYRRA